MQDFKKFSPATIIFNFFIFRFELDEKVTLTINLAKFFYFKIFSFLFSANKSKHTLNEHANFNLKPVKPHKLVGDHLIFILGESFPMRVIKRRLILLFTL